MRVLMAFGAPFGFTIYQRWVPRLKHPVWLGGFGHRGSSWDLTLWQIWWQFGMFFSVQTWWCYLYPKTHNIMLSTSFQVCFPGNMLVNIYMVAQPLGHPSIRHQKWIDMTSKPHPSQQFKTKQNDFEWSELCDNFTNKVWTSRIPSHCHTLCVTT